MKSSVGFAFVSLAFFANFAFSIENLPQVKFLGSQYNYSNPEYNQGIAIYATRENETYNNIFLYWNLVKDFSQDSKLITNVYATDETFQGGELVLSNTTPICQASETRELLPKILVVAEALLGESCIKKGVVEVKDMGQLRFEVLIPDIRSKGKYFRADYSLYQGDLLHFNVSYYNELSDPA